MKDETWATILFFLLLTLAILGMTYTLHGKFTTKSYVAPCLNTDGKAAYCVYLDYAGIDKSISSGMPIEEATTTSNELNRLMTGKWGSK